MGQWTTRAKRSSQLRQRRQQNPFEDADADARDEALFPRTSSREGIAVPPSAAFIPRGETRDPTMPPPPALQIEDPDAPSSRGVAPAVVFTEDWRAKTERLRQRSAFGSHPGWSLLPVLIKSNDDLRQEQLAAQLIQRVALILAKGRVPVWLYPYDIVALTGRGGSESFAVKPPAFRARIFGANTNYFAHHSG